jgi:hypothetical protein
MFAMSSQLDYSPTDNVAKPAANQPLINLRNISLRYDAENGFISGYFESKLAYWAFQTRNGNSK